MYRLLKDKGNNSNLVLENMDTRTNLIIGKLTMNILSLLEEKEGIRFGDLDEEIELKNSWDIHISEETGKEIASKAMTMHRPVRDQRKHKEEQPKKSNKEIDAMDVLLGLASYN